MFDISSNIDEVCKWLDDLGKQQVPYATAVALTRTAQNVQHKVIAELPSRFTLRTTWYKSGPYAFKITPAKKTFLESSVYTRAPFMQLQESGGIKIAHGGKKYLAIPTDNVRRNKRDIIPQNLRPKFLLAGYTAKGPSKKLGYGRRVEFGKSTSFIGTIRGHFGIWTRTPDRSIKLMYTLRSSASITPRLYFEQTARRVIEDTFSQEWGRAMNDAMRTAR